MECIATVEFPESPIPEGCFRGLDEVTVKRDGCIWRINKNDADPFPSNPHAHNTESRLKMDLSNGNLYLRRDFVGKAVSKKDLLFIRDQANLKGVVLPALSI